MLVDFFMFSRRFPRSIPMVTVAAVVTVSYVYVFTRSRAPWTESSILTSASSSAFAHSLWAEKCAKMNGHYPYPLLDILSTVQRIALYVGSGVVACLVGSAVTKIQTGTKGQVSSRTSSKAKTR